MLAFASAQSLLFLPSPAAHRRTATVPRWPRPHSIVLAATRSDSSRSDSSPPRSGSRQHNRSDAGGASGGESAEAPLRGFDVLHALQRAANQKAGSRASGSRKGKKRRTPRTKGEVAGGGGSGGGRDYSDVRPIEIRRDWEGRIEELEKRIQELQERYHH